MIIQLQSQHLSIFKLELELLAVEVRIVLVDDTVVIGADDNDVRGVIVLRTGEKVDVVGCDILRLSTSLLRYSLKLFSTIIS